MILSAFQSIDLALGLRMLASAAVVVAASLAAERAGPFIGAMIATLPLSAGPAYLFIALDHDAAFLAAGAVGGLLSVAATAVFLVVYVAVAPRHGTNVSLAAALGGWAASMLLIDLRIWAPREAVLLALSSTVAAAIVTRTARRTGLTAGSTSTRSDIALRAGAVMLLVLAVITIGRVLGSHLAGLAALAPVIFTSLIAILQPRAGGAAVASVMANAVLGMIGYGFALGLLNAAAIPLGSGPALLIALATCLGWNCILVAARRATGQS